MIVSDDSSHDNHSGIYPVDLDSGEVLPRYSSDPGRSLRYSPEGTRLAAMTGYTLTVWDTDSQEEVFESGFMTWHTWNQVAFLDEDTVVGILDDGPAVYDLTAENDPLQYVPEEEAEGVLSKVETNPVHDLLYGLYISDADEDGMSYFSARVWHRPTGEDLTPEHEDRIPFAFMTLHPDGDVIASDPASPSNAAVRRVYRRRQWENIWLRTQRHDASGAVRSGTGGICYVLWGSEMTGAQREALRSVGIR
jgi:WD40 repeat protein